MKNVVKTQYNSIPSKGSKNTLPSLTVPDQTMPLQTILERFTRGQSVATLTPVFHGDEEFPDFDKMDKVEIEEYKNNLTQSLKKAAKKQPKPEAKAPPVLPPEDIEGV